MISPVEDACRRPGRPRDAKAEGAILDATIDLVSEVGFGGLTVDAVAARAGCGKGTIYRRWESKEQLLVAALRGLAEPVTVPDTGSLRTDLEALWRGLAGHIAGSNAGRALAAIVAEANTNADVRTILVDFVHARRDAGRLAFERAKPRGEVPEDLDVELALDMICGPVFYRHLISGAPVQVAEASRVVAMVLDGITVASRAAR